MERTRARRQVSGHNVRLAGERQHELSEGRALGRPRPATVTWVDIVQGQVLSRRRRRPTRSWARSCSTCRTPSDSRCPTSDGGLLVGAHDRVLVRLAGRHRGTSRDPSSTAPRSCGSTTPPSTPPGGSSSAVSRTTTAPATRSCSAWSPTATSTVLRDGLTLSNGIGWSPDGGTIYVNDSIPGTVWAPTTTSPRAPSRAGACSSARPARFAGRPDRRRRRPHLGRRVERLARHVLLPRRRGRRRRRAARAPRHRDGLRRPRSRPAARSPQRATSSSRSGASSSRSPAGCSSPRSTPSASPPRAGPSPSRATAGPAPPAPTRRRRHEAHAPRPAGAGAPASPRRRRHLRRRRPTWRRRSTRPSSAPAGSTRLARRSSTSASRAGRARAGRRARSAAPIARPHQILCIGLNYSDHADRDRAGRSRTSRSCSRSRPTPSSARTTTCSSPAARPRPTGRSSWASSSGGARRYLADEHEAAASIAGYVLVNDVSERAFQMERGGQWSKGKSAETFNPAGPWLVTPGRDRRRARASTCGSTSTAYAARPGRPRTMIFSRPSSCTT